MRSKKPESRCGGATARGEESFPSTLTHRSALPENILTEVGMRLRTRDITLGLKFMTRHGVWVLATVTVWQGLAASHLCAANSGTVSLLPQATAKTSTNREQGTAWLGIEFDQNADDAQSGDPLKVARVALGSPAAKGGIQKGDLVLGVQGEPAAAVKEVEQTIRAVPVGTDLKIELLRAGQPIELTITRGSTARKTSPLDQLSEISKGNSSSGPKSTPKPPSSTVTQTSTGIFINGRELTPRQVEEIRATYASVAPPGRYWYDSRSGLYGFMGREAYGFIRPGHNFGTLPPNASNGNTGVFINGREINLIEASFFQQLFGAVYRGRWWLDGRTGNVGAEGNPMPLANVIVALQQAKQRGAKGQGGYSWHSNVTGASGGSEGGCTWVNIPGSGSVTGSGCD